MRPRERRESGEQDLFRSRLDEVIDMEHALVKLVRTIDWRFLEEKFGAVYKDGADQPPLPPRLMAGLAILKHAYNLGDDVVCELWIENPYYQCFCGEEFFQHRLPLDRSSMTHWRNRMGEERFAGAVAGSSLGNTLPSSIHGHAARRGALRFSPMAQSGRSLAFRSWVKRTWRDGAQMSRVLHGFRRKIASNWNRRGSMRGHRHLEKCDHRGRRRGLRSPTALVPLCFLET